MRSRINDPIRIAAHHSIAVVREHNRSRKRKHPGHRNTKISMSIRSTTTDRKQPTCLNQKYPGSRIHLPSPFLNQTIWGVIGDVRL
jgi:hypothetical protein